MGRKSHFRITGGIFKGRLLNVPKDRATRPMQGALRETLFNVLRPELVEASVLDLFSGTGSIGLEALSRGAAHCDFFERHKPALGVLRANIAALGVEAVTAVYTNDLLRMNEFPETPYAPYDIIFIDPPFAFQDPGSQREIAPLLKLISSRKAVAPGALLIHQLRRKQSPPESIERFQIEKEKQQGSVRLAFYRYS